MLWPVRRVVDRLPFPAAPARRYIQALVVTALGAAVSIYTWTRALDERQFGVSKVIGSLADETTTRIQGQLDRKVNALRGLATYWQLHGVGEPSAWRTDTRMTIDHFSGLQWVAWVPADSTQTRVVARDSTSQPNADVLDRIRRTLATPTPMISEDWSEAYSVDVLLPVQPREGGPSMLAARIQVDSLWLRKQLPGSSLGVTMVSEQGDELVLQGVGSASTPGWMNMRRSFISPAGTIVRLNLAPWPDLASQVGTPWPHYFLVTGLFLSGSMGILLFQFLRMQDFSRALARTNDDLDARIAELSRRDQELRDLNEGLEKRVESRTGELSEALREVEAFSHSISHDLRSPLGAILNFAAVVEEDYGPRLDAEGRRLLERIRLAAGRSTQLLNALLEFAGNSGFTINRGSLDMKAIAEAAYTEAIAVEKPDDAVHFSVGDLPVATGDAAQVHRVFLNLVGNAIKYSRGQPTREVEIGGSAARGENVYWIRDNGSGFDSARASEIFEPFRRLHGPEVEGSGLGLAVVAKIVRRHGGRVWAESNGGGATFYFTLPTAEGNQA